MGGREGRWEVERGVEGRRRRSECGGWRYREAVGEGRGDG